MLENRYHNMPQNKKMFLKKEFDVILKFYKKNPYARIPDCAIEVGYDSSWVRLRLFELLRRGEIQAKRFGNTKSYLFYV